MCNEHKAMLKDTLLFWGSLTDDNAKRSFGGYTCQIDKCERYTRQELEEWRGELKKEYPFFDELKKATDFFKSDEVLISIDDLKKQALLPRIACHDEMREVKKQCLMLKNTIGRSMMTE